MKGWILTRLIEQGLHTFKKSIVKVEIKRFEMVTNAVKDTAEEALFPIDDKMGIAFDRSEEYEVANE